MARLAKAPKTTATYTVVDIHNVSQSLVRQIEWLEQEIHASANRVVLLEDQDEAEELREDVQKKLTPLWNGALKLTLEGTDKRLVYAIERVRVPGLHRKDIVGARISLTSPETTLDMLMITPECTKILSRGENLDLESKLAQLKLQLIS